MKFTAEDADYILEQHLEMGLILGPKTTSSVEKIRMISIEKANAKLEEWLKAAPTVLNTSDKWGHEHWVRDEVVFIEMPRKAKLVCIGEL